MDGEDAQAVIQVRPELPLLRPGLQVAVGRRDQPHVGADRFVAADALKGLLLEHAQHLGLGGRRHVADLVEEQRATRALLELEKWRTFSASRSGSSSISSKWAMPGAPLAGASQNSRS